jgi:hypothetical protein
MPFKALWNEDETINSLNKSPNFHLGGTRNGRDAMTRTITFGNALEKLSVRLSQIGRGDPQFRYCHVNSTYPATRDLLGRMLPVFGGLALHVSQIPEGNGRVSYCCYYGDVHQQRAFEAIAVPTVSLVNMVLSALGETEGFKTWFDLVHRSNQMFPDDDLTAIDRKPYEVWQINAKEPDVVSLSEVDDPEALNDYQIEHGPPDARCEVFTLRFDPFTAMGAVVGQFLTNIRKLERDGSRIGEQALHALAGEDVIDTLEEAKGDAEHSGVRDSADAHKGRPEWVNDASQFGPTTMLVAAKLLGIKDRQLRRLIRQGTVWREPGTKKRYYFQHREFATNQKLQAGFRQNETRMKSA